MSFQWVDIHPNLVSQRKLHCIKNVGGISTVCLLATVWQNFHIPSLHRAVSGDEHVLHMICLQGYENPTFNRLKPNWGMMSLKYVSDNPSKKEKWNG